MASAKVMTSVLFTLGRLQLNAVSVHDCCTRYTFCNPRQYERLRRWRPDAGNAIEPQWFTTRRLAASTPLNPVQQLPTLGASSTSLPAQPPSGCPCSHPL